MYISNCCINNGALNSRHQHSPMQMEGIHTTGCCSVPRRDRLLHCYHHLGAVQPLARCLTLASVDVSHVSHVSHVRRPRTLPQSATRTSRIVFWGVSIYNYTGCKL
jgi:hypothetical protein